MLEKEMMDLQKVLYPILKTLVDNKIGVAKMLLTNKDEDDKPVALIVFAVEAQKIAAINEFVDLLQQDRKPSVHKTYNFDLDSQQ